MIEPGEAKNPKNGGYPLFNVSSFTGTVMHPFLANHPVMGAVDGQMFLLRGE